MDNNHNPDLPLPDEYLRAEFSSNERELVRILARKVAYLTQVIDERARAGLEVNLARAERKAVRWALEQIGVELPPNPPAPAPASEPEVIVRRRAA